MALKLMCIFKVFIERLVIANGEIIAGNIKQFGGIGICRRPNVGTLLLIPVYTKINKNTSVASILVAGVSLNGV
jgi:hypothetical protein